MELDLQVYLGARALCAQLFLLAGTQQPNPPPAFGLINEGGIGQRR
jgi:hypothetical protein